MEPIVTGKNLDLSLAARGYIQRKMDKVNRLLNNVMDFNVVVSEEKTKAPADRYVIQITINDNGTILRAEERGDSVISAADRVDEVITRRIEHHRGKLFAQVRGNKTIRRGFNEAEAVEPEPRVVKTKSFDVKPMPLDEAIEQMELLGHDFFLFRNAETSRFNLVYRRRDGNYGLIEVKS